MQISQEIVAKEKADLEYEKYRVSLEDEYDEVLQDLMKTSKNLREEIVKEQFELNILKSKQAAYITAQKRKEEMAANKNYYQLNLSDDDLGDIYNIRNVQKTLVRKEAVDKVLWEIYYKPAYDTLMIHLFGDRKDKVSGIYKITSVTNDKAYIGQSVDIKERLKSHIKSTISYSSTSNKLYSTMKSEGIQNFTFEILEEVPRTDLNEREIYWIEMYKTQDYGMNSTRGGS